MASVDVESLFAFFSGRPSGVTQEDLQGAGFVDTTAVMQGVQVLLNAGRLSVTQVSPGKLMYTTTDPQKAAKFRGLDAHHLLVYQQIEKLGSRGAWSKSLKDQTNLQAHIVTKATKELIRRGLVKEVKTIQGKNRKVYMLADVEPDKSVSGGAWYHEGEFAHEWIEALQARCLQYLEACAPAAVKLDDVYESVVQQPTGHSTPTPDDIAAIMRAFELDEVIFCGFSVAEGQMQYSLRNTGRDLRGFDLFGGRAPAFLKEMSRPWDHFSVPCFACPVRTHCYPGGGAISPERCEYMMEWLAMPKSAKDKETAQQPVLSW